MLENYDLGNNVSLAMMEVQPSGIVDPAQNIQTAYFSLVSGMDNMKIAMNYNIPIAQYIGYGAIDGLNGSEFMGQALQGNPYLALVGDGFSSISKMDWPNSNLHTVFAVFQGQTTDLAQGASGMVSEINTKSDNFSISSQLGYIDESQTFLGSQTTGAFSVADSVPTWFYNIAASYNLDEKTQIFGLFSQGITRVAPGTMSLVDTTSNITSNSFGLGITQQSDFVEHDKLGFSVSQPLRVASGNLGINMPYAQDLSGNIYQQQQNLSLSPSGRETDLELFYSRPVGNASINFGAMRRFEPDNISSAPDDNVFMFKIANKF